MRNCAPLILDSLAEVHITIECEDLAAELQLSMNVGLSYGGTTPYACLYGAHPRPVFFEDSDEISAHSDSEPFFEHQQVRLRSTAAFQQALLQYRTQKASTARPRKEAQSSYSIGDSVDVFRRPKSKDLTGWRGPATVLALLGEGLVTVRWQSTVYDVPVHHLRPHINISSSKALPKLKAPSDAIPKETNAMKALMEKWDREEVQLNKAVADVEAAETKEAETAVMEKIFGFTFPSTWFTDAHRHWETFYGEEASDQFLNTRNHFDTLAAITACMPTGTCQNHSIAIHKGNLAISRDAERDFHAVFSAGRALANSFGITSYAGVVLCHGRRHIPLISGIHSRRVIHWFNEASCNKQLTLDGTSSIDFLRHGVDPGLASPHHH